MLSFAHRTKTSRWVIVDPKSSVAFQERIRTEMMIKQRPNVPGGMIPTVSV